MLTQIINGQILTPQGWMKDGSVLISDGKILEVTNSDMAIIGADIVDAKGMYIVPGFISMHAHGGGGHDFTEATPAARSPLGVLGKRRRSCFSRKEISFPISTTGCGRLWGSPRKQSITNPITSARAVSFMSITLKCK